MVDDLFLQPKVFDFDIFQSKLESELVKIYTSLCKKEKICSIALYTDQGGMSICMSANTEEYFQDMIKNEPDEACYYKWVPDAWKYDYIDSSELDTLSRNLSDCVLSDNCYENFDTFMDKLIEKSILSLKHFINSVPEITDKTILLFTISDFNNQRKQLQWIKELNHEHLVQEYTKCMDVL